MKITSLRFALFLSCWIILYVLSLSRYSGSCISYTVFSTAFLLLIVSGFVSKKSYSYICLTVMLWLGFWLKLAMHLWLAYPYQESIGLFDDTPQSWDMVLDVAAAGAVGVLLGRVVFVLFSNNEKISNAYLPILNIYEKWRKLIWLTAIFLCAFIVAINSYFGFMQVGLMPKTIWPWPLNAVASWMVSYGVLIVFTSLLWWDVLLKKNSMLGMYAVAIEGFLAASSMLSRGVYIFHVVPVFLAMLVNRRNLSGYTLKRVILLGAVSFSLFFASISLTSILREGFYSNKNISVNQMVGVGGVKLSVNQMVGVGGVIAKLAVDRWIGIEGVMVLQAYSQKSYSLLLDGLSEKRMLGNDLLYSRISMPPFHGVVDVNKFQFSEIPGPIAFFWYSGSLFVVSMGLFILALLMQLSEVLVIKLSKNPLLCTVWAAYIANTVAQFGIAPRGAFISILLTLAGIGFVALIQSCFWLRYRRCA